MMTLSLDPQLVAFATRGENDEEESEQGIGQAIGEAIGGERSDREDSALGQGRDDVDLEGQGKVVSAL
jgi:hypothetical protein